MLRISRIDRGEEGVTLKLEGRLVEGWINLLREKCAENSGRTRSVLALDLSAVEFASREGAELLRRLKEEGVRCEGASPFLRELIIEKSGRMEALLRRYVPSETPGH